MSWLYFARGMAWGTIVGGMFGALTLLVAMNPHTWVFVVVFGVGVVMLAVVNREISR